MGEDHVGDDTVRFEVAQVLAGIVEPLDRVAFHEDLVHLREGRLTATGEDGGHVVVVGLRASEIFGELVGVARIHVGAQHLERRPGMAVGRYEDERRRWRFQLHVALPRRRMRDCMRPDSSCTTVP